MTERPDLARRDLSAPRCVVSGGATVPAELVYRIEERLGVIFSIVYGTTECCPLITQTRLEDALADRAGTLGQPLPQTEMMVADPVTGDAVAPGAVGELRARLPGDGGVQRGARGDRRRDRRRGLVPHRGPGVDGRARGTCASRADSRT